MLVELDAAMALRLILKLHTDPLISVTSKKSPNVYKSCLKMILPEKWKILTTSQKLPKIVGYFGKIIVATGFEKLPKFQ